MAFVSPVLFFSFSHVAIELCAWVARRATHNMSMKKKRGGDGVSGTSGLKVLHFLCQKSFYSRTPVVTMQASCEWNGVTHAKQERIGNEVHWIIQQPRRSDLIGREAFHECWYGLDLREQQSFLIFFCAKQKQNLLKKPENNRKKKLWPLSNHVPFPTMHSTIM